MVGDTKTSVISNDHLGWLRCDGRELAVADYYSLWRVIGYEFGGAGDTFFLPDAQARVAGYVGTQADINLSTFTMTLGADIGEYTHTLTISEMPAHTHGSSNVTGNTNGNSNTTTEGLHAHNYTTYVNSDRGYAAATDNDGILAGTQTLGTSSNGSHYHQIFNTGGSNAHNNIQPTLVIGNMFIYSGKAISPITGFPYTENTQIL
jgi:microcystin-dependent protein